MMTRKAMQRGMAALCAALLLAGCEKDETPHGSAPSTIENIVLNTADVRPGQPVTASISLPTGGENISKTEYSWVWENGLSYDSDEIKDGKAYFEFSAPTTPGKHTLQFNARYTFVGPDKDGNIYKDLSTSLEYTVAACDLFRSVWGDDIAATLNIYPNLTKYDDNTYLGVFADELSTSSSATINRAFIFTDGALSKIQEFENQTYSAPKAYTNRFLLIRSGAIHKLGMQSVSDNIVDETDPTQTTPLDTESKDDTYRTNVGTDLSSGQTSLLSVLKTDKTRMQLEAYRNTATENEVTYSRTYVPANAQ